MQVGFALVPGPDGRQWVAWQVADGQITVTFPAMDPAGIEEFVDAFSNGMRGARKQADQANSGLLIPGLSLDPVLLDQLKNNTMPAMPPT